MARRRRRTGKAKPPILLLIATLAAAGLAQVVFTFYRPGAVGTPLIGLALMALAAWILSRQAGAPPRANLAEAEVPRWLEAGLLGAIVVLALVLRLYSLDTLPNAGFRDEGENGNVAIRLLKGEIVDGTDSRTPIYIEHNTQNAAGYMYPVAVAFKLFGISITSERMVSVFFGVLSVAVFYFLARLFFSIPISLLLTFLLATLRWHINFSRIGFLGIMTLFLEIPLFYFLWKGLHQKSTNDLKDVSLGWLLGALALAALRGFFNFSRLGMFEVPLSLLFQAPLIWMVFKGLKDRRSSLLIVAGGVLALALYSYIAARLLIGVVAGMALYVAVLQPSLEKKANRKWFWMLLALLALGCLALVQGSSWDSKVLLAGGKVLLAVFALAGLAYLVSVRKVWMQWAKPLVLATGAAMVVGGPLYNFTIANWTEVFARSSRVSIFNNEEADKRAWGIKLKENIPLTLGMYNVRGDGNPRHNLPGTIMLHPVLAAWFALGALYCLFRIRRPRTFFFFLWWQITLVAGYFSIEAPQAYRTIGAIPVVLLIAGEAMQATAGWAAALKPRLQPWIFGILGALLLAGGAYDVRTYFVDQAEDPGCWAEFSASEFLMGRDLKALQPNTHAVVRADWADSYTFRFMTYPERNFERFDPSRHVPMRQSLGGQNLLYILDDSYMPFLPILKSYYPHGTYNEAHHPYTKELMYWTYYVPAADLQKPVNLNQGLKGTYFSDIGGAHWSRGGFSFNRVDPFILFNWTVDPVPGFFSVEWSGHIRITKPGTYHFYAFCNDYASLEVAGRKLAERPHLPEGNVWIEGAANLAAGTYPIRIRYYEARNYSRMEAWWQPPGGNKEVLPSDVLIPN